MDGSLKDENTVEAGVSPAGLEEAAETAATTEAKTASPARTELSINELEKLEDLFPVAFLPRNHALAVAIMSYDGGIDFGLLGDYDALPDIDAIAEGIRSQLVLLSVADELQQPGRDDGHLHP